MPLSEELKQQLTEDKSLFKEIGDLIGFKPVDEFEAVKKNRDDILTEKKVLQKKYSELEQKINNPPPGDPPPGDPPKNPALDELKNKIALFEQKEKEYRVKEQKLQQKFNEQTIKTTLLSSLAECNVKNNFKELLLTHFSQRAKIGSTDNKVYVKNDLDDTGIGEYPVDVYFKKWQDTEKAKDFIQANVSKGGGAHNQNNPPNNSDSNHLFKKGDFKY